MTEHTYIRARWLHDRPDFPIDIWSELDAGRFETRKLEYFRDGRVGYASADGQVGDSWLGIEPFPPLAEILANPEFISEEVSKEAFEQRWLERSSQ
jgi:hypothetical protein